MPADGANVLLVAVVGAAGAASEDHAFPERQGLADLGMRSGIVEQARPRSLGVGDLGTA